MRPILCTVVLDYVCCVLINTVAQHGAIFGSSISSRFCVVGESNRCTCIYRVCLVSERAMDLNEIRSHWLRLLVFW